MRTLPLRAYVAASLLFAAIGVWIVVAPTAVAYQPRLAAWVPASFNDVAVGAILVLASLGLLVGLLTAAVRARLRTVRGTAPSAGDDPG